jgi:hypothetical protein
VFPLFCCFTRRARKNRSTPILDPFFMTEKPLIRLENTRFGAGYWRGMRQPVVLVSLQLSRLKINAIAFRRFDAAFGELFPTADLGETAVLIGDDKARQHPLLSRVLSFSLEILSKMGMPIMSGANAFQAQEQHAAQCWQIGLPAVSPDIPAPKSALAFACGLMNELDRGVESRTKFLRQVDN